MNNTLPVIILKRLLMGLFILFGVSILITVGVEALAGDVCSAVLGQAASPETVAACQVQLGLNQPVYIRYLDWLFNVVQGDFGTSLANKREVSELLSKRMGNTFYLATAAIAIMSAATPIYWVLTMLRHGRLRCMPSGFKVVYIWIQI